MKKIALIAFAATALAGGAALAQQKAGSADQTVQSYADAVFAEIDTNKDGSISKAEFRAFTQAGLARQQAAFNDAFAKADTNKDGKISKAEAAAVNPQLAANFAKIDVDNDGFLTVEKIRTAARRAQAG